VAVNWRISCFWKRLKKDESGSVAILTIGLFLLTVTALALITDVAAIGVAKRSLIHITESAAIHGSHELDLREYYRNGANPGVPIDCYEARRQVNAELLLASQAGSELVRPELQRIIVTNFFCSGSNLELTSSAIVNLPFRLPQSSLTNVEIHATVGVESERRN
jgi:hypothetical protein